MTQPHAKAGAFRALHQSGCFPMPNPWDAGSACYLAQLGFKALATSSAAYAFSRGLPDRVGVLDLEGVLDHTRTIVNATDLPVNADFQHAYADTADGVTQSVSRCVDTGVAGLSVEDATPDPQRPLYPLDEALARLDAARSAIDRSGAGVVLTARAECFLVGHPDPLAASIERLVAYKRAGADVLFAPGVATPDDIRAIVDAVAPTPVNVVVSREMGMTLADLADLGVRRVSVGSALARAAWGALVRAAAPMASEGSFEGLLGAASFDELNRAFS